MLPCGTYNTQYRQDMAVMRTKLQWGLLAFCIIFFACCPLFLSNAFLNILNLILITIICVLGLNIITGYCGQLNIGQSAFMATGAFIAAWLAVDFGFSFWAALPCAVLAGGLAAALFGLPSMRVKDLYLALFTLAAQFIIMWFFRHVPCFGGAYGLHLEGVTLGGMELLELGDFTPSSSSPPSSPYTAPST